MKKAKVKIGKWIYNKQEKPWGHYTPPFSPSPQGAKYITVTQGTSPSGVNL